MGKFYAIVFLLGIVIPKWASSQTVDCEQTIVLASEEFNAGHFFSVPSILDSCLASFSRDQRQRAFLLLTQTYLLLDDPIGAKRSFLEVLWANPEFVPDENLHAIDVVYLSKRFTATPKFSWFVGAGSNVSPVRVIHDLDIAADADESYLLRPGYNVGVGGEYSYNNNIRVRVEANYFQSSYKGRALKYFEMDQKTIVDRQTWVSLPVYLCYSGNAGNYRPYGFVGYSISKLLSDKVSITLEKIDWIPPTTVEEGGAGAPPRTNETETFEISSPDFDFLKRRIPLNHSIIFGGGVKYKVGLDFVFAELRYSVGLKNIINAEYAYGNHAFDKTSNDWVLSTTPASAYTHVDDYFRLDNLAITFGFLRPLYKPRELKTARTRGVLRRMKRTK